MGTLSYPHTLTNGTTADADEVMADLDEAKGVINGNIEAVNLHSDAVSTVKIANGAVTSAKIGNDEVKTANIEAGAVGTTEIATDGVETANIKDLNVTTGKLEADAIDGTKIADDAVDTEHLAANSVDTAAIDADAVTYAEIDDGTIRDLNLEHTKANGSVMVQRIGPNTTELGTEGLLKCRCETTIATGKNGWVVITVTYATDAIDGNPAFSAAPHCESAVYFVTSTNTQDRPVSPLYMYTNGISTSTFYMDFTGITSVTAGKLLTTFSGPVTA